MHKAGFVNIVGNPNVGKSTLMNQLVGERISIATFKAQTTRHRIMGIVNTDDAQIVFSDTPGVLKPNYKLQESMLAFSESALQDADVLLYVTDVVENPEKNSDFLEKVAKMTIPVLLLINKIDQTDNKSLVALVEKWHGLLPSAEILPISAKNKFGIDMLMKRVKELLPDSPPYFDKDQLTDKPARFFVSEIVREKILLYYSKEIPYSVEVRVESFKETDRAPSYTETARRRKAPSKAIRAVRGRRSAPRAARLWRNASALLRGWRYSSRLTKTGATQSASLITSAIIRDKACRLGGGCGTETSMMYAPLPDITL